jgi:hypothetical protein
MGFGAITSIIKKLSDVKDVPGYVIGRVLGIDNDGNPAWVEVSGGGGGTQYPQVTTYADLPDATEHAWEVYIVRQATGVIFINRKSAGFYQSDGTAWKYLDNGDSVNLNTDQTIDGVKTFLDSPVVPDAMASNQAVSKGQLDAVELLPGPQGEQGLPGADGEQGPQGIQGDPGIDGKSAYQIWIDNGNTGTEEAFLLSLAGEPGPVGPQGIQGIPGIKGDTGDQGLAGATGATGPAGPGIASGGTAGQILVKTDSADYNTQWQDNIAGILARATALDKDLTTPPGSPAVNDTYIVSTGAADAWSGKDGKLTYYTGAGWGFIDPPNGYRVLLLDEMKVYVWGG